MKTKVRIIVDLVVEHEDRMPMKKVEDIARSDIHHSEIAGCSTAYGKYKVVEIARASIAAKATTASA